MKKQAKISLDAKYKPDKGYRHSGVDGYNFDSGTLAFGTDQDWKEGKTRRNKKKYKPMF